MANSLQGLLEGLGGNSPQGGATPIEKILPSLRVLRMISCPAVVLRSSTMHGNLVTKDVVIGVAEVGPYVPEGFLRTWLLHYEHTAMCVTMRAPFLQFSRSQSLDLEPTSHGGLNSSMPDANMFYTV